MGKVQSSAETTLPTIRHRMVSNNNDSMFTYGAVVANSPQYSFIIQGVQQTDRSGSTGTWS